MCREDWLADPGIGSDLLRGDNREPILAEVRKWCAQRSRDEAIDILSAARIPSGPVLSPAEITGHEQVAGSGVFGSVSIEGLELAAPIARAPVRLSTCAPEFRQRPALARIPPVCSRRSRSAKSVATDQRTFNRLGTTPFEAAVN